jgi:hypothetical protein
MIIDAPSVLLSEDGNRTSYRIDGQRRYDLRTRTFTDAEPLTRGQARRLGTAEMDADFTAVQVVKAWRRLDPDALDEELGRRGLWLTCSPGTEGAVAYWQVSLSPSSAEDDGEVQCAPYGLDMTAIDRVILVPGSPFL